MIGKFKIWDKFTESFIKNDNGRFYLSMNGELMIYLEDMEKASHQFIPVFSTGKTDKNGVELFDGDVVRNKKGRIGIVLYHEAAWSIDYNYVGLFPIVCCNKNCEKIGNKFENPELMEAK